MEERPARTRRAVAAALALVLLALLLAFLRPKAPTVTVTPTPAAPVVAQPPDPSSDIVLSQVTAEALVPAVPPAATPSPVAPGGIRFRDAAGAWGRIVDEERRPAVDLPVVLHLDGRVLTQTRTGSDGEFVLPEMQLNAADKSHFEFALLATDGKGLAARFTNRMGVTFDPDEKREITLPRLGMGTLVLRESATLTVRVSSGGAAVEGATVWAEEEVPCFPGTEEVATGPGGIARIDSVPKGRWTVFARCPGRGSGRVSVDIPAQGTVEIPLSPRSLEIEAVDSKTGKPFEGVRFSVAEGRTQDGKLHWNDTFPPLDPPATDSAGKTRIPDLGEVALRLRPIPPGCEEPLGGVTTEPVEVDALATTVRVPVRGLRTVRWRVLDGERTAPPDGSKLAVGEERMLQDTELPWAAMYGREGRVEGGEVVVGDLGWNAVSLLARAPDGSLARLAVDANAERGAPVQFLAPRRLTVVVRDEDGKPVGDPVALMTPEGVPVAQPHLPAAEGKTVFDGLYAGEVVVCALARIEFGGAEVARVDLAEGDRTVEAVVGRSFKLVVRFRVGGKPKIPAEHSMWILTPGPDVRGEPHGDVPDEAGEDPEKGEVRLHARPHAPGKAVRLQVTVPGHEPVVREALPPAEKGGETVVEIDL